MRSRPLVAALLSALLVAVASARGDRRLRAAVGAGDDDAVGDDDAAFQSNAGGGKSGGGGASPNPYLAQLPPEGATHNAYANLDGAQGFQDAADSACHVSPAKARTVATACYAIAAAHSQMRCSLCVAPKLPHPCKGVDATRFCAKLQKDLPHTAAPQALRAQREKRRQAAEAASKQAQAAKAEKAEKVTKAAKTKRKQTQKQRALAKALAARAHAGGGLLQPGARAAGGKDDTAYKKLDSRCRRAIVANCAADKKRGRSAQLHTVEQCTSCATHLPGAGMANCRNGQEAKYLCTPLVRQYQHEMKTERDVKFKKRAAAEKAAKFTALHGLPARASAAGLAHDLGKPFNARDGLAGTENTHFRPYHGFKQGYGEMAACVLDRSEGIYDTFQTVGTCSSFTEKKGWDCYAYRATDLAQDLRFCCSGGEHAKSGAAEQMCKAAILPVLQPIETTVVPLFKKCTHKPAECERWRKMFAQCLDMREGMQHIMDKSYVCAQTLQKVLMPILQKAIDGARMLYGHGAKSDVTKRAKQYMDICPKRRGAGACSHIAALAHFQEKFDEAQLNPWDN